MYDGSAIAAAEVRFREDLWRTAPNDAVDEAGVEYQRFGPLLATVFGELPHTSLLNIVQGAAEPEVVESGHLAAAVEWLRTWEVSYRISVAADRPGTEEAEQWLSSRGYEPGGTVRRYVHTDPSTGLDPDDRVEIRNLRPLETEGMSHIFADALNLPKLATVLMIGLPRWEGWSCYSAYVDDREVACGSMRVCGELALLGLDATLPDFRERGCQSALITRRLVDATATGCEAVAAEVWNGHPASAAAAEVLEHAGFKEIAGRTTGAVRPGSPSHSADPSTKQARLSYPLDIVSGLRSPLFAAAAVAAALAAPAAASAADYPSWAPNVPWGAGCKPALNQAQRTAANCGATLVEGEAIAPPDAPTAVKRVIAAANEIDHKPYIWGGGHASFFAKGYDCSGAVSYALHGADLLSYTQVSGQLAHYGSPGTGKWITIYANAEHVFMVVAGLRFDTRNDPEGVSGPRWKMAAPESTILPKFTVRHPAGL